jgi:hypothetical protein
MEVQYSELCASNEPPPTHRRPPTHTAPLRWDCNVCARRSKVLSLSLYTLGRFFRNQDALSLSEGSTDLGWLSASSTQAELQLGRLRSHSTRGSQRWCPLHTSIHTHPATAAVRAPSRRSSFSSQVVNRSDCVFHHHHHPPLPARPYPLSWTLQRAPVRPRHLISARL